MTVSFVCFGNICRSPMAEAVLERICRERGIRGVRVRSYGTSGCSAGQQVYPPAAAVLREKGYDFTHKSAKITQEDIKGSDCILVMDSANYRDMLSLADPCDRGRILKLGNFRTPAGDIADPWYTGDFVRAYSEILDGCEGFAKYLASAGDN